MKKIVAVLALVLGFTGVAKADLMVEPYLGYEFGKTKDAAKGDLTGTQMGLRLGYKSPLMLWAALDGTFGVSGEFKPDVGGNSDAKRTTLSAVVGVDLPILLRAWVGYGISNEMKLDSGTAKGHNYKLGVGFTALPFVSLNFEYLNEKYDDLPGGTPGELKNDSYVVSVSLPLSF